VWLRTRRGDDRERLKQQAPVHPLRVLPRVVAGSTLRVFRSGFVGLVSIADRDLVY